MEGPALHSSTPHPRADSPTATSTPGRTTDARRGIAPRHERIAPLLAALLIALAVSRLWDLDYQAFHHDESIHARAIWDLARKGPSAYQYDPVYHAPLFYHTGALFSRVLPDSDFTARLPFAVAGCLLVAACVLLRRVAGSQAMLLAIALLVVSPTVTYYSRFAREDVFMAALLSGIVAAGALYIHSPRLRWLSIAWICVVLGYCNKENSYVNHALVCAFAVGLGLWRIVRNGREGLRDVFVRYLPLTRLLVIFGFVSTFTFLYVAIDCRVAPDTPLIDGVLRIARHSVAMTPDARMHGGDRAARQESGFFSAPGREPARGRFLMVAFIAPVVALGLVEAISAWIRRRRVAAIALTLLGAWIGYGAAAFWVFDFALWAARFSGGNFLEALRQRLLCGGLLLAGLACLPIVPVVLSRAVLRRTGRGAERRRILIRLARPTLLSFWALAFQVIIALAIYCVLFSSLGTNAPAGLRDGLYEYIAYWFRQQTGEFRIWGPWWYYLPRLLLYECAAVALIAIAGFGLLFGRRQRPAPDTTQGAPPRVGLPPLALVAFAAWLAVGTMLVYALLNEKVYWLGTYQAFALNLVAAFLFVRWLARGPRRRARLLAVVIAVPALVFTLWQHALAVHLFPDSPTEPIAYVTTSHAYKLQCREIVDAHRAAVAINQPPPVVSLFGEGVWPGVWYLRRLTTTAAPFDPNAAIAVLDDSPTNRRRLALRPDSQWRFTSVPVRGWWFAYGEGLPARQNLVKNIAAFFVNAHNDHRDAFTRAAAPPAHTYPTGFRDQLSRFLFTREAWYPATGSNVLFAWRTGNPARVTGTPVWLDGFDQKPKESNVVARIGSEGEGPQSLRGPRSLALLLDGSLAVADAANGRIQIFGPDGAWVRSVGEGILSREVTGPCGVAADADGELYVADTWNHAVRRFNRDGELVATCGPPSTDNPAQPVFDFFGPRGIAVAGQGEDVHVYVTDTGNKRVVVLDRELRPRATLGQPGKGPGQFNEPVGICIDADMHLYVADTGNGRIQRFNPDGAYVEELLLFMPAQSEIVAVEPNLVVLPDGHRLGMTWSTLGVFLIIDPDSRRAWPWKPAGDVAEPVGIAVGPDWSILLADRRSSSVLKLSDQRPPAPPPIESPPPEVEVPAP